MIIVTTDSVPGQRITATHGIARGNTIRAKHLGKDILAGLRMLIGGEIKEYTEMLTEARNAALQRMEWDAQNMGADAVVNVRFVTSQVMAGAAELLAYGTAVSLEKVNSSAPSE
ncbi:MAG: YbjQ family protein [Bacteroidota bacterium]|nr:YbjQ family protein [Bacteroidota bacterium]